MIQVVRRGVESWEVTRTTRADTGLDYESIGWVKREGDFYYAYFPEWKETGVEWIKQPRGYLLPKAAIKAVTDREDKKKASMS